MGGSTVTRFRRMTLSWLLLAAMLVSLPGGTTGHFVCTLGMAEAGPSCPLCHGHASAQHPGPGVGNRCCKFVAGQSAPDSHLALTQGEKPGPGHAPPLPSDSGLLATLERELTPAASQRTTSRTPTSAYLSNFLRL